MDSKYVDGHISGIVTDRLGRRATNYTIKASVSQAKSGKHLLDAECKTNSWAGRYILKIAFQFQGSSHFRVNFKVFSDTGELVYTNEYYPYFIVAEEKYFQQEFNIIIQDTLVQMVSPTQLLTQNSDIDRELGDLKKMLKYVPEGSTVDTFAPSWSRKGIFEDMGLEVFTGRDVLGNIAFAWIGIGMWGWYIYRFHPYGDDTTGYGLKEPRVPRKIVSYDSQQITPDHIRQRYGDLAKQQTKLMELSHESYAKNSPEDAWRAIRQRLNFLNVVSIANAIEKT